MLLEVVDTNIIDKWAVGRKVVISILKKIAICDFCAVCE